MNKLKTRLPWLERELRRLHTLAGPWVPTYAVAVWCGEKDDAPPGDRGPFGWALVATGVRLHTLYRILDRLRSHGWSEEDALVRVSREGAGVNTR